MQFSVRHITNFAMGVALLRALSAIAARMRSPPTA